MKRSLRISRWLVIATLGLATTGCEVNQALDDAASGKTEGREHIGGAVSPVMSDELFSSSNRASKPPKAAPSAAPAGGASSAPPTPSSRPPVPNSSAAPVPVPPPTSATADEQLAGDDDADVESATAPPPQALAKLDIQLSTGVSLAQTGPDGTLMSFSIDYQFTATPPVAGARYGVVVQRRDGQAVVQEEKLKVSDSVQMLVPKWRPQDGPFYAFIVELNSQDRPIAKTDSIELTGPSDR